MVQLLGASFNNTSIMGKLAKKPAILDRYSDAVFSADPPDYSALRKIFHDVHQCMDCSIPISFSDDTLNLRSEKSAIPRSSTERLFEILGSNLSDVGRQTGDPTAAWSQQRGISLLQPSLIFFKYIRSFWFDIARLI